VRRKAAKAERREIPRFPLLGRSFETLDKIIEKSPLSEVSIPLQNVKAKKWNRRSNPMSRISIKELFDCGTIPLSFESLSIVKWHGRR
jgi:hypothetical protein